MSFVEQERSESRSIETEYLLPEPYGHHRKTWIDNFTDRVSVWHVGHGGWLVRIQPLD